MCNKWVLMIVFPPSLCKPMQVPSSYHCLRRINWISSLICRGKNVSRKDKGVVKKSEDDNGFCFSGLDLAFSN